MAEPYEIIALKYASQAHWPLSTVLLGASEPTERTLAFYLWVIRNSERTLVVDTGHTSSDASARGRCLDQSPVEALAAIGVAAGTVPDVVLTHLHHDHAGGTEYFAKARFHLQAGEMAFATGPCMCHALLRQPYDCEHVVTLVRRLYSGDVVLHDGEVEIAPGISLHPAPGHTAGLQAVRVLTRRGPVVLASDVAHLWENIGKRRPFPVVADMGKALRSMDEVLRLSGEELTRVIPGHDPAVLDCFPPFNETLGRFAVRVDRAPSDLACFGPGKLPWRDR